MLYFNDKQSSTTLNNVYDPYETYMENNEGIFISDSAHDLSKINDPIAIQAWKKGKFAFDLFIEYFELEDGSSFNEALEFMDHEINKNKKSWIQLIEEAFKTGMISVVDDLGQKLHNSDFSENNDLWIATEAYKVSNTLSFISSENHITFKKEAIISHLIIRTSQQIYKLLDYSYINYRCRDIVNILNSQLTYALTTLLYEDPIQNIYRIRKKTDNVKLSLELNGKRHAISHIAQDLVISDWYQNIDKFQSVTRASNHYADWLLEKGLEYQPRTIAKWISKFAKENNIRL